MEYSNLREKRKRNEKKRIFGILSLCKNIYYFCKNRDRENIEHLEFPVIEILDGTRVPRG